MASFKDQIIDQIIDYFDNNFKKELYELITSSEKIACKLSSEQLDEIIIDAVEFFATRKLHVCMKEDCIGWNTYSRFCERCSDFVCSNCYKFSVNLCRKCWNKRMRVFGFADQPLF